MPAFADEREEGEEERAPACPACGGPGVPLGRLGRLMWWRCRDCGMDFSTEAPAEERSRESRWER